MIRVLIIDDSAVMRNFLSRVVNAQSDMEVAAVAADPVLAIDRIRRLSPDVITLDVEMPKMDGLAFLGKLMAVRPLPVIMISSQTRSGADTTLRALELGAVDFIAKPADLGELDSCIAEIIGKIRAAAVSRVARRSLPPPPVRSAEPRRSSIGLPSNDRVVAIGASTGGVEALRELLIELPVWMPPVLIAQHMPAGFTEAFARRLDGICRMSVKQAEDGELACHGVAYIAPGGKHLTLVRNSRGLQIRTTDEPPVNRHRPSVDPLFRAIAQISGIRAIGVMLTGMGSDGADAMLALFNSGAHTIAQDEASCIVFGMPRQAILIGAVREVLPLRTISRRLEELCGV
jgi:two-component system, chemotaxis family, protein-glutamate methylesterase/glutaminase